MRVRDDLVGRQPYGAPQLDVPIRLNVNENPFPPSEQLANAIAAAAGQAATSLNRYPDREALALRESLARYLAREAGAELTAAQVWAANGSNEVMLHLLQAYGGPGRTVVTFTPTYSMYPDYCRDTFTRFRTVPRTADYAVDRAAVDQAIDGQPDIVVMCSPNNPTGTVLDPDVLGYLLHHFSGLVVVDEAYAEFRPRHSHSAVPLVASYPNLVVTRTMSKAFSCAGLRLGYAAAGKEIVDGCRLVRLPYHLSAVTQAVALAALQHTDELLAHVDLLRDERDRQHDWLVSAGYDVARSGANFLMFGRFTDPHAVWQQLLDRGVLVRETGPEGFLRVSIGTPEENEAFRQALPERT